MGEARSLPRPDTSYYLQKDGERETKTACYTLYNRGVRYIRRDTS